MKENLKNGLVLLVSVLVIGYAVVERANEQIAKTKVTNVAKQVCNIKLAL